MMNNELRPYEEMKNSYQDWLAEVPNHWRLAKAKRIFRETSIKDHPNEELLSATQTRGVIPRKLLETRVVMPMGNFESFKLVKEGNFVISLRSFQGGLEYSKYHGIVSPAYNVLEEFTGQNRMYFKHLMKSQVFISELQRNVTGIRQGKNIDVNDFREIIMPIPPRSEQDQIVRYLDHQLAKINKFIKAKKKLIAVFKEQIECYVYGNDAEFSEDINSWETSFPKEWKMIKASRLTKEKNIKNKGEYELLAVTQDRGVVFKKDCEQNYVSPAGDLSGLKLVSDGDYVISLRSFQGGIEFSNIEGIVSPAYNIFSLVNDYESEEYKHYYKQLFKTKAFISLLNTVVSGIRDGKNINYSDFVKLLLPVPPQNVANKVYKLSLKIDKMQNEFNAEFALLKEFRDALISDVVTGKVDVRNITIEELEEEIIEDTELDEDSIDDESLESEDGDE
ncbi:restriction endonuclease subunit S [Succinispira mobilis]|uniref:restriction endonuclease subunit S n=1 Tax=Succinispira mobilis TaxID=78120 RepID=UPI000377941A|nr:restriction endonuclease subunit S [Succinispira mobilis]